MKWQLTGLDTGWRLSARTTSSCHKASSVKLTTNRDFGGHSTDYRNAIPACCFRRMRECYSAVGRVSFHAAVAKASLA